MRIGIFGNDNNVGLICASGLQSLGHAARLVVTRKNLLHRPEGCVPAYKDQYPDWIHDASDLTDEDYASEHPKLDQTLQFLAGSDALFLNHTGPSLSHLWAKPYVCLLTGSDLSHYGNFQTLTSMTLTWNANYKRSVGGRLLLRAWSNLIARQRDGIAGARAVVYPLRGLLPEGDALLDSLGVADAQRICGLASFMPWLPEPRPRGDGPLRVLSGSRINWKLPLPAGFSAQDNKRMDVLITGAALFLRACPNAHIEIHLVEKGLHVGELKSLAHEEGIAQYVKWHPEMPLCEFLVETVNADLIVDHFGPSLPGLCAYNGLAAGKPVIANFQTNILETHLTEAIPACHATSPAEVAFWLEKSWRDPAWRADLGEEAQRFAERHLSPVGFVAPLLERLASRLNAPPQVGLERRPGILETEKATTTRARQSLRAECADMAPRAGF